MPTERRSRRRATPSMQDERDHAGVDGDGPARTSSTTCAGRAGSAVGPPSSRAHGQDRQRTDDRSAKTVGRCWPQHGLILLRRPDRASVADRPADRDSCSERGPILPARPAAVGRRRRGGHEMPAAVSRCGPATRCRERPSSFHCTALSARGCLTDAVRERTSGSTDCHCGPRLGGRGLEHTWEPARTPIALCSCRSRFPRLIPFVPRTCYVPASSRTHVRQLSPIAQPIVPRPVAAGHDLRHSSTCRGYDRRPPVAVLWAAVPRSRFMARERRVGRARDDVR